MQELMLNFGPTCPLCRPHLRRDTNHPGQLLSQAARQAAQSLHKTVSASSRARASAEEDNARVWQVQEVAVGFVLDVLDTENIWWAGVVRDILPNVGHMPTLLGSLYRL